MKINPCKIFNVLRKSFDIDIDSDKKQLELFCYHLKVASGPESPGDFLKKLNRHDFEPGELLQTLQALRVNLTGKPLRYLKN